MVLRQSVTLYLALFIALLLNACALSTTANKNTKANDLRFNNLLELSDLSERAFVYYLYCLQNKEVINSSFMKNFEITSNLLLDEAIIKMKLPPQLVVKLIVDRRSSIQQQLSEYYHSQGCQSEEGELAMQHYKAYAQMDEKQIEILAGK